MNLVSRNGLVVEIKVCDGFVVFRGDLLQAFACDLRRLRELRGNFALFVLGTESRIHPVDRFFGQEVDDSFEVVS